LHYNIYEVEIYNGFESFYEINKPILTIGTFDGVHIGHQKIIQKLIKQASEHGGETVLFTFNPHPRTVLFPDSHEIKLIQTQEEKLLKLKRFGIQHTIIYPFTKEFSNTPASSFISNYLVDKIHVNTIIIGYDHQFGKNREGSLEHLKELSPKYNFNVIEIPAQDIDEVNVSSTKIRLALENGDMKTANAYLGEPFQLNGVVVEGKGIGRTIGFPTANVQIENPLKIIPKIGVYAVRCTIEEKMYHGMMNIGIRPTVSTSQKQSIEVHLFDCNENLYNRSILVEVIQFIRDEQRFETLEHLTNQLKNDAIQTRHILSTISSELYAI
jgi:riboflavin kinase / FMN adenylyltransferase